MFTYRFSRCTALLVGRTRSRAFGDTQGSTGVTTLGFFLTALQKERYPCDARRMGLPTAHLQNLQLNPHSFWEAQHFPPQLSKQKPPYSWTPFGTPLKASITTSSRANDQHRLSAATAWSITCTSSSHDSFTALNAQEEGGKKRCKMRHEIRKHGESIPHLCDLGTARS